MAPHDSNGNEFYYIILNKNQDSALKSSQAKVYLQQANNASKPARLMQKGCAYPVEMFNITRTCMSWIQTAPYFISVGFDPPNLPFTAISARDLRF